MAHERSDSPRGAPIVAILDRGPMPPTTGTPWRCGPQVALVGYYFRWLSPSSSEPGSARRAISRF